MKKITIILISSILLLSGTMSIAQTQTSYDEEEFYYESPRTGFMIAGMGFMGYEALENKQITAEGGFRFGKGIGPKWAVLLETTGSYFNQTGRTDMILFNGLIKAQRYAWDNFYYNLGAGVTTGRTHTTEMSSSDTRVGFIVGIGAGYEFRLGKSLFAAPEVKIDYRRLAGNNFLTAELGGILGWHF